jgi:hypothetical protein
MELSTSNRPHPGLTISSGLGKTSPKQCPEGNMAILQQNHFLASNWQTSWFKLQKGLMGHQEG